ncbi:hypothetical protein P167DRAFT_233828 [Morchella conica CCBAS932]|uniref:Uncharacterized protein n=1 Tax=Morchella conica CCBAS932 TaxID=1392247 RepID=A0A3N4KKG7_9PEZI|nr:hypothetical protein P167DRAFT_233828 [Morchella conica CCBAS932]
MSTWPATQRITNRYVLPHLFELLAFFSISCHHSAGYHPLMILSSLASTLMLRTSRTHSGLPALGDPIPNEISAGQHHYLSAIFTREILTINSRR